MRLKIASSLLIVGSVAGCYVQPYNPPPAQVGQNQPPPAQNQPPPADQQQPPPTYAEPRYGDAPPPAQPPPPPAQPAQPVYTGPIYDNVTVEVGGNNVPSIDVFYNDLAPHGSWYSDPTYGWVFAPPSPSYVPYSNGHWVYTDYGYTWQSADPFGWATDHYGRWVWANRWVWRPDTVWGPAWVQWREGDGFIGWAPAGYADDAYIPETSWRFVGAASLFAPDVPRFYVSANIGGYFRSSVPARRYLRHGNQTWVGGPSDDWQRRYRVQPRRETFDPGRFGRFNDQQRREAERRAREHQRDWDTRRRQDDQFRRDMQARQQREDEARRRQAEEQRRMVDEQRRRDDERRRILEEELSQEEQSLATARDSLTQEQTNPTLVAAVKSAQQAVDPSPAQIAEMRTTIDKASGRIRGLQATVAEHEKNIEALKKELGALKP